MRSRRAPKLLLAAALLATVPLKAVQLDAAPATTAEPVRDAVSAFLQRHGFATSSHWRPNGYVTTATSPACRLRVRQVHPAAFNVDSVSTLSGAEGRLTFVFDGELSDAYPYWPALMRHHWTRVQQRLGKATPGYPVFAVAASEECAIAALPWSDVAAIR